MDLEPKEEIVRQRKVEFMKKFGSQTRAAKELTIKDPHISEIICAHRLPSRREREKLRRYFSEWKLRKLFPKSKAADVEQEVVN